jgi:membrane protein YdbS with pleckstrin-like domain
MGMARSSFALSEVSERHSAAKVSAVITYWPQLALSIPAAVLLVLAIVRNVLGVDVSFYGVWWLLGANVLLFSACVALALLHSENKAWRYAAIFNAWLFVLALIASILRFGA